MKLLGVALLGFLAMADADRPVYPESWGEPPEIQTMDYRALPGGYGHGSSTLASWIHQEMTKEKEKTGKGARAAGSRREPEAGWPPAPLAPNRAAPDFGGAAFSPHRSCPPVRPLPAAPK